MVEALADEHQLLVSDIKLSVQGNHHESRYVDVGVLRQVVASQIMEAITNFSAMRPHRRLAFDVNSHGCYNMMRAAVEHKIQRVINTSSIQTVVGPPYGGG